MFAGDPAGPGSGDPQRRDRHGFNGFRLSRRPFLIGEVQQQLGSTIVRIGGWRHFSHFADLRRDRSGGSLADPHSSGMPLEHRGNWAIYALIDGRLWQSAAQPARAVTVFARGTAGPSGSNLIDRYFDAGIVLNAPFRNRPDDIAGLGIAYAHISNSARRLASDLNRFDQPLRPHPDHEAVAEVSYQIALAHAAFVQPNIQYVLHPGGGAADTLGRRIPNALVIAIRTSMRLNLLGARQTEMK
jgi:porin